MKVFWCYYKGNEWGSYVIAPTHNKAKAMFHEWYMGTVVRSYIDIRCYRKMKLADCLNLKPQMLDDPDDPLLKELGLRYATDEEMEAMEY